MPAVIVALDTHIDNAIKRFGCGTSLRLLFSFRGSLPRCGVLDPPDLRSFSPFGSGQLENVIVHIVLGCNGPLCFLSHCRTSVSRLGLENQLSLGSGL